MKRIYVKYKNAILSHIDCFFLTCKDKTYDHVLSQIFNCFDHDYVFQRSNEITGNAYAHEANLFMCERSNIHVTK